MGKLYHQVDLYDHPFYYDMIFDEGSTQEVDFLQAVLQKHSTRPGKRVLEPACGTARLLIEFAQRGYSASGFDASETMIHYAKARTAAMHLRVQLSQQRMESFHIRGHFDLVFSLISSFKYLLTEAKALAHFQTVCDSLHPGGLFILGLHLTDYARDRPVHERWVVTRGDVRVVCNTRTWPADRRSRRERVRNRLRIEEGTAPPRHHESTWPFRTYSAAQLRGLLQKVPALQLETCYDFGYDLTQPRRLDDSQEDIVLVLRKVP